MARVIAVYMITTLLLAAAPGATHAEGEELAVFETDLGEIAMELFPEDAPDHVAMFRSLIESGFYDGTALRTVIPGFTVQVSDPGASPGRHEAAAGAKFNTIKHSRGIVLMAGTQFIVVHEDSDELGLHYAVIGRIATEEGFETLDRIAAAGEGEPQDSADPGQATVASARLAGHHEVPGLIELPGPGHAWTAEPVPVAQEYVSRDRDVSFTAPAGWTLRMGGNGHAFMEGPLSGLIPPTITIHVKHPMGKTFDGMTAEMVEGMEARSYRSGGYGDITFESVEDMVIDGMDVRQMQSLREFTGSPSPLRDWADSTRAGGTLQFRDMLFYDPHRSYVVGYANDRRDFEAREPEFEGVLDTLVLVPGASHRANTDMSRKFDAGLEEKVMDLIKEAPGDGEEYGRHDIVAIVFGDKNKAAAAEILGSLGAINISAAPSLSLVAASVPADRIHEFALHDGVFRVVDGEAPVQPAVRAPPPVQFRGGTTAWSVACGDPLVLAISPAGRPACVSEGTAGVLEGRGTWWIP